MITKRRWLSIQNQALLAFALIVLFGAFVLTTNTAALISVNTSMNQLSRTYGHATSLYDVWLLLQRMEVANLSYYESCRAGTCNESWVATFEAANLWADRSMDDARQIDIGQTEAEMQAALDQFGTAKNAFHQSFRQLAMATDAPARDRFYADSSAAVTAVMEIRAIGEEVYTYIADFAAEVDGITYDLVIYPIVATGVILFLAALMIALLHLRLNRPLLQLAAVVDDLAAGQFDASRLGSLPQRQDEIGTLARNFVEMVEAKEARRAELQAEITAVRAKIRT